MPTSTSSPPSRPSSKRSIAAAGSENTDLQLEIAADALRLPPWDAVIDKLSGGEKRRVALCRLLLSKPDMLLLDEPTNHLDAESVDWLEQFLQRFPGTVVAITHDRYFLDNAAEWILELDRGPGIPCKGNYSDLARAEGAAPRAGAEDRGRAHQGDEEGTRVGAPEPQGRARPRARRAWRASRNSSDVEYQKRNETNEIFIPVAERLGNEVIEFENVSKSFGDRLLIDNLSFKVPPGAIVGIIGPNGAGKSTLFRMITGKEKPDSGEVKIGHDRARWPSSTRAARSCENDKTVWEDVSGGLDILIVGKFEMPVARLHRPLQLQGQRPAEARRQPVRRRARAPAPGQDADRRAATCCCSTSRRNDLDVETLRALEDALLEFAGSMHGDQPRPLVPRPHRHPHPGRRGRLEVGLLRRQLPGVRGRQEEAPGRRGREAASGCASSRCTERTAAARSFAPACANRSRPTCHRTRVFRVRRGLRACHRRSCAAAPCFGLLDCAAAALARLRACRGLCYGGRRRRSAVGLGTAGRASRPRRPASGLRPPGRAAAAPPPGALRPFADVIKDAKRSDGLFALWQKDEKVWLELKPDDFNKPFFLSPKIKTGHRRALLLRRR